MLFNTQIRYFRTLRLRKIAKQVRAGSVPKGIDKATVFEALKLTAPRNATEFFGFLQAKIERANGKKEDLGLVSVKSVSRVFCEHLVDAMTSGGELMTGFSEHKMGSGSAAAVTGDTALGAAMSGAQGAAGSAAATHGASSIIYQTIGTLTSTYGEGGTNVREHGVFNESTAGILLDRSTVAAIAIATDDVITWTYDLTVVTGG